MWLTKLPQDEIVMDRKGDMSTLAVYAAESSARQGQEPSTLV